MKAIKLIGPLLAVVGLLAVSVGSTGAALTTASNGVSNAPVAQGEISTSSSTDIDGQWAGDSSVAGSSLTDSVPNAQAEALSPDDPYVGNQWAVSQIQVAKLWQVTTGNQETLVAVLDTGIDQDHEDLNGKIVAEVNFTDSPTPSDTYGHGTHIAGIIAANGNNGTGIIGMAPGSRLMNVKIAGDKGRCQPSAVAKGIIWAVDNGASVINISVELKEASPGIEDAINYAWSQGAVIVAAAGNEGSESPVYPAGYQNCIAVAGTRQDDTLSPLSNYGDWIDASAPGFKIYSTLPDNSYGYKSGTSFATAYVSGLAALLFDVVTDANGNGRLNDEVRTAIESGCQQLSTDGMGWGRIDAAATLAEIDYTL